MVHWQGLTRSCIKAQADKNNYGRLDLLCRLEVPCPYQLETSLTKGSASVVSKKTLFTHIAPLVLWLHSPED